MPGLRIAAVRLQCLDVAGAAAFYRDAFGFSCALDGAIATLTLGAQRIELVGASGPGEMPSAPAQATTFQHFAIVVSEIGPAYRALGAVGGWTAISRAGPEKLPPSSGSVEAFKFRDPEEHPLELLCFPRDARPSAWQNKAGLFLGIDHTAITVSDSEAATAFYARYGFSVTSRGTNHGIEQQRLDDVDDPIVEVIGLEPPGGAPPHLELLCYRKPTVIPVSCRDDGPLATRILLSRGDTIETATHLVDPDGHRLSIV